MSNKITTREASSTQEHRVAKTLGAQITPNSGAGLWRKGDLHLDEASLLIECKTCINPKESFSIKKEWIEKDIQEAFSNRLSNTAIAFSFCYDDNKDYYIIDDKLMRRLVDALKEDQ